MCIHCKSCLESTRNRIAYDDNFGGLANDAAEGERIASTLDSKPIVFMANHGITVTAPTVHQALDDFYYLEVAARVQILAESRGKPLKMIPNAGELAAPIQAESDQAVGHFESILRILDREEPEFRS